MGVLAKVLPMLSTVAIAGALLPGVIWPGEIELTAPLFCSAPYTEPMVVSDTIRHSDGESTNFTLYCVGSRGEFTDAGFLRPFLVLWLSHMVLALVLGVLAALWSALRTEPEPIAPVDAVEY